MKKLIVGWFTFSCCGDSAIIFTELLNQNWQTWTKIFDFKYVKLFRKPPPLSHMDLCFVEGAIASQTQAEKLKTIRSLTKTLVAVGSCAVTGLPASQRNQFDQSKLAKIQPILKKFNYSEKVQKPSDLVTIDHSIPGCPMDEAKFLEFINQFINHQ